MKVATGVGWEQLLQSRLSLYGHRNWIVVADSAYPAQSQPGIETILTAMGQLAVVEIVLRAISASPHVRTHVYTDQELRFVAEEDAPGITAYRQHLTELVQKSNIGDLPHEAIIAKLDQAARMFNVLILKSDMTIPYTSVFFELDCAYWSSDREVRLRSALANSANG